jgi:hypothetical protein
MSVSIERFVRDQDAWFVNNRVFAWFQDVITGRHQDEVRALELVEITAATNGCYLDAFAAEDPDAFPRFVELLKAEAQRIASGDEPIPDSVYADKDDLRRHFATLCLLLEEYGSGR